MLHRTLSGVLALALVGLSFGIELRSLGLVAFGLLGVLGVGAAYVVWALWPRRW
jgi:ABC-type branched-subunit amino acid transport system permease subunit